MHVRAAPPSPSQWGTDEGGKTLVSQKFVNDFIAQFTVYINNALLSEATLTETDFENLGQKDPEKYPFFFFLKELLIQVTCIIKCSF